MPRRTLLTLILTLAPIGLARADLITLIPGSTSKASTDAVRGTVTAESPSEITVKVGNVDQKVPTAQILSIRYDGRPGSLDAAAARESAGALAEAADLYKKAAGEASVKPFVMEDALFSQARVTADLGLTDPAKTDAAIALLDGFLRAHGNGRHVLPALETLAKLQLQKGNYDAVQATVDKLGKIPGSADRAAVLRARIATRKGDHTSAISELDAMISSAPAGSVKRRDAQLAKAESLVAQKKFPEAESLLYGVIDGAPPEDFSTQAAAYNTLGDSFRAAGRTKDALNAYLRTDLIFFKDKEQHPKALARIVQIWRELKRDDRADEVFDRLKSEYPKSPYLATVAKPAG